MKEVRFSQHSLDKLEILSNHKMSITKEFIIEAITNPDKLEIRGDNKRIAQKNLDDKLVIRIVYQEFIAFILVITLYPGRKTRYDKNNLQ